MSFSYLFVLGIFLFVSDGVATTLAVLDFSGTPHSKLYTDRFRSGMLSISDDINMISRENLLLFEMDMETWNCSLENCEVEIAQQLGTDYLIAGYVETVSTQKQSPTKMLSISLVSSQKGSLVDIQQMMLYEESLLDDIYNLGQRVAKRHFVQDPATMQRVYNDKIIPKKNTTSNWNMTKIASGGHFGIRRLDGIRPFVVLSRSIEVDIYESGRANQQSPMEIIQMINARSRQDNIQECYEIHSSHIAFLGIDCNGWRLPTNMEWEYLATAGEDFPYAGSGNVASVANYMGNSTGYQRSGLYKANAFGLYDLSGNLWEMVWRDGDRTISMHQQNILLMGGSYNTKALLREESEISLQSCREDVGYRIVRTIGG